MEGVRRTFVLTLTVILGFFVSKVNGQCLGTEFSCANTNCVPASKVGNTVNDCGDNSDEVSHTCPEIFRNGKSYYQWHCATGGTPECLILVEGVFPVQDGEPHCPDSIDEKRVVGSPCWNISTCTTCNCEYWVTNSVCNDSYICQCWDGYYQNTIGTNCTKRILGDACGVPIDCKAAINDSQCLTSNCACDYGYMQNGTAFCQKRVLHDSCVVDIDCSAAVTNSNCTATECMCNSGYYEDSLTVCTKRKIDDSCTLNTDCSDAVANSECDAGSCKCTILYLPSNNKESCNLRELGDSCSLQVQCSSIDANASCINGVCACNLGYYNNGGLCSPLTVGGGSCRSTADCQASVDLTICINGVCQCKNGYYYNGTSCELLTLSTGSCTTSASCVAAVPNSECVGGKCQCKSGYKATSDTQCVIRTLNDSCSTDADCSNAVENSHCESGKCKCTKGYEESSTNVCTKKTIGSSCTTTEECDAAITGSVCDSSKCACPGGTKLSSDALQCSSDGCTEGDFICKMPWLIALIILGVLLILAGLILLIYWRCKRKKNASRVGPVYEANEKKKMHFDWSVRAANSVSVMYGSAETKEPDDVVGLDGLVFKDSTMLYGPEVVRSNTFTAPASRRGKKPEPKTLPKKPHPLPKIDN